MTDPDTHMAAVHVDDMALFAQSKESMERLKEELKKEFNITDLGELKQIVGLEVARDRKQWTLTIKQIQYIKKVLN